MKFQTFLRKQSHKREKRTKRNALCYLNSNNTTKLEESKQHDASINGFLNQSRR
jgi:hypothetical protein